MVRKNLICLIFIYASSVFAQTATFISPGMKLGYALGENGGFIYVFEVSLVFDKKMTRTNKNFGIVCSYEILRSESRLHIGAELNYEQVVPLLGCEAGPTVIFSEDKNHYGLSATLYYGAFLIPYFRLNVFSRALTHAEIGSFFKIHFPTDSGYLKKMDY